MSAPPEQARRWRLSGRVQGVGFRPFVYRLAHAHGLSGWVRNLMGEVEILGQGRAASLEAFQRDLLDNAPPLSRPRILGWEAVPRQDRDGFRIRDSGEPEEPDIHVPPDYFTCQDCLAELHDPRDRRHRYPFINCTQCGPRYTLIARLPYDRANTSMARFPLCAACRAEYEDPLDRRFHAEPVACPECGPGLSFQQGPQAPVERTEAALAACVGALRAGAIVAVKGVGGYHLMCDARSREAVARLRRVKPRPAKPLAVMFPVAGKDGLAAVRAEARPGPQESACLASPMRPIVLTAARPGSSLDPAIAPGLAEVGIMLPYAPLHHLLLADFGGPVVATSGNLSGEPVLTEAAQVHSRLAHVAEAFLHHDRPILRPADDPVFRVIAGHPRPLRLGRGCAPLELELPEPVPHPLLALGAHMKNTVALAWDRRVVVSPHIGDMGTPRSLEVFEQVAADLQALYGVSAQRLVCDAHPGYATSRWAARADLPVTRVYHHHAHASALVAEHGPGEPWLVFTWDGVGYGEDGTLWGGETLYGRPGAWQRVASLRPFRLPGAERAAREPWRSALGLCWGLGQDWTACPRDPSLLHQAWSKGINAPLTTAAGRLFDAAAALAGVLHTAAYEGHGPMLLEALAQPEAEPLELPLHAQANGLLVSDWAPLVGFLQDQALCVQERAGRFHGALAQAIVTQALRIGSQRKVARVGLTGGVFQNRVLTERAASLLARHGFDVHLPEQLPANDAAISFGQVAECAGAHSRRDS